MSKTLSLLASAVLVTTAAAQSCFEANYGTPIGNGDDVVLPVQSIGFPFVFDGVTYTDIHVSTNGFVYLANASTTVPTNSLCCTGNTASLVASTNPIIAPLWNDLNMLAANGANVFVNSSATACIVTWDEAVEFGDTVMFDLQLQLLATGEIRFTYDGNTLIRTGGDCLVGCSPGNNAAVPGASDFSAPGVTGATTAFELFSNTAAQFDLAGQSVLLTPAGPTFVHVPSACRAAHRLYGSGCVPQYASIYEWFTTTPSIDLSNTSFTMLLAGNTYVVIPSATPLMTPSGTAINLNLTDDSETTVTLSAPFNHPGGSTTTLNVCSNGHVSTASNGAAFDYTPTPAELLNWTNATWAVWRDMIPNTTANVWFEEIGGVAYITWLNVVGYVGTSAGTTPSTFQLQFHLATGNVEFVFGSLDTVSVSTWTGGEGWIVGYSTGGASLDPGSTDLSTGLPVTLPGVDQLPLGLSAAGLPTFGSTVSYDVGAIPAGTPFGAVLLGFTKYDPGIDLTSIGMAGCRQYTDGLATLLFVAPVGTASVPFNVPTGTGFLGFSLFAQAVSFSPPATVLGAIASNGVETTIGY